MNEFDNMNNKNKIKILTLYDIKILLFGVLIMVMILPFSNIGIAEEEKIDKKTKKKIIELVQKYWNLEEIRTSLYEKLNVAAEMGKDKQVKKIERKIDRINASLDKIDTKIQTLSAPIAEERKMERVPAEVQTDENRSETRSIWGKFERTIPMRGCDGHNETFLFYGHMQSGSTSFWFTHQFPHQIKTGTHPDCKSHLWNSNLYLEATSLFRGNSCHANWEVSDYASNKAKCGTAFYAPDFVRITVIADYEDNEKRGDVTYVKWY